MQETGKQFIVVLVVLIVGLAIHQKEVARRLEKKPAVGK